jgi:hypothetical protein
MSLLHVLYDGWPFCFAPNSPASLHLLAILASLPENIHPVIAFPQPPPAWAPASIQTHIEQILPATQLEWEQRTLPGLQREIGASLLHLTTETASLWNNRATIISPTGSRKVQQLRADGMPRSGLITRLRAALAAGGTARAHILWPQDLAPRPGALSLPPAVHPSFTPRIESEVHIPGIEIPEAYVLYHGPGDMASIRRALEAWTWAAGPLGESYPLVLLGLNERSQREAELLADSLHVRDTVVALPPIPPGWVAPLYQLAAVVFPPAEVPPWGGSIRHALACGRPVVATETERTSAIVGPAAILVDPADTRRLGASVIGVIVKEELSVRLEEASRVRSAGWRNEKWGADLASAYQQVLASA